MMQLGICWGGLETPEETIDSLLGQGVEAFETSHRFFLEADEQTIQMTGELFRKSGIAIWSVHAPWGGENNLSHLEESKRRQALKSHKRLLRKVGLAGVKVMVIHPGEEAEEKDMPLVTDLLLESLKELMPVSESCGVKLALENMLPKNPGADCGQLRKIVEEVASPWLGVCFDSGHAHVVGDVLEGFEVLKDFIVTFHLQDNDGTGDMHLQPPYGTIDWGTFSKKLRSFNFREPIIVEAMPWGGAGMGWLQKEVWALLEYGPLYLPCASKSNLRMMVRCPRCNHFLFGTPENWFCRCQEGKMSNL